MHYNFYGDTTYTIRPGDTLYSIARWFNTSVEALIAANPGINPMHLQIGQNIYVLQCRLTPVPRPNCLLLNPTDLFPDSKGLVFIEPDIGSVFALVTNVPAPTVIPGGEVYKLWISHPLASHPAVTIMTEPIPGYWIARLVPGLQLSGASVIISAEKRADFTTPQGLIVAMRTIP